MGNFMLDENFDNAGSGDFEPEEGRDIMSDPVGFRESQWGIKGIVEVPPPEDFEGRRRFALEVATKTAPEFTTLNALLLDAAAVERYLATGEVETPPSDPLPAREEPEDPAQG